MGRMNYLLFSFPHPFFYGKDKRSERSGHLMVSDHCAYDPVQHQRSYRCENPAAGNRSDSFLEHST